MALLEIKNLSFSYPDSEKKALENISLKIYSGEFIVICGETGCGKTTLLQLIKRELSPAGKKSGNIYYKGTDTENLDARSACFEIGFVMQNPENQIINDKVWHELSFGLENMGLPSPVIKRRICEMSSYFGIEDWFFRDVDELSGGQKQLLNLASVMVTQPKILILDEPTSQLDPIAASDFFATLQKLNRELSLTIIMSEHRLEDVFPAADKVLLMKEGGMQKFDSPEIVCKALSKSDPMLHSMPAAVRIYNGLNVDAPCPISVKEGRRFIEENFANRIKSFTEKPYTHKSKAALEMKDIYFRYGKDLPDILCGTNLTVYENEIYCILGGNASGKTTALGVCAGILKAYSGRITVFGKKIADYRNGDLYKNNLALLPQDVQTVFSEKTVRADLAEIDSDLMSFPFDITGLLDKHPYDLSGGEQQLCALAKVLMQKPRLLLLDEPTKGMDAFMKRRIAKILDKLKSEGMTIVIVTHDLEFAAGCADRCALFFGGEIVSCDVPSAFFSDNSFYTTSVNRMTRGIYDNIITAEAAIELCRQNGVKNDKEDS